MAANNLPYPVSSVPGTYLTSNITGFQGSPSFKNATPDFNINTTISDEIRKHEPRKFYLLIEMLANHLEEFKGELPGFPDLTYEVVINQTSTQSELNYSIIFTRRT